MTKNSEGLNKGEAFFRFGVGSKEDVDNIIRLVVFVIIVYILLKLFKVI